MNQAEPQAETWTTDDTSLASYLVYHNHKIQEFKWDAVNCTFLFPWSTDLQRLVDDFDAGKALVEPDEYTLVSSRIRKAMFEDRDRQRPRSRRHTAVR